jgi:hypothetical protein
MGKERGKAENPGLRMILRREVKSLTISISLTFLNLDSPDRRHLHSIQRDTLDPSSCIHPSRIYITL